MNKTASLYIRIDPEIKSAVEEIYRRYGMSLTEAINVFLYQSRNIGGLPFDLRAGTRVREAVPENSAITADLRGKYKSAAASVSLMEKRLPIGNGKIIPASDPGPASADDFMPKISTKNWRFNREDAYERG